jgi:hypothetical protein
MASGFFCETPPARPRFAPSPRRTRSKRKLCLSPLHHTTQTQAYDYLHTRNKGVLYICVVTKNSSAEESRGGGWFLCCFSKYPCRMCAYTTTTQGRVVWCSEFSDPNQHRERGGGANEVWRGRGEIEKDGARVRGRERTRQPMLPPLVVVCAHNRNTTWYLYAQNGKGGDKAPPLARSSLGRGRKTGAQQNDGNVGRKRKACVQGGQMSQHVA